MLGNGRLEAHCMDGVKRLCHIRGKMRKKVGTSFGCKWVGGCAGGLGGYKHQERWVAGVGKGSVKLLCHVRGKMRKQVGWVGK